MRGPVGAGGRTGWGPAPSGITLTAMVSVSSHSYSSSTVLRPPSSLRACPVVASATQSSRGPLGGSPGPPALRTVKATCLESSDQDTKLMRAPSGIPVTGIWSSFFDGTVVLSLNCKMHIDLRCPMRLLPVISGSMRTPPASLSSGRPSSRMGGCGGGRSDCRISFLFGLNDSDGSSGASTMSAMACGGIWYPSRAGGAAAAGTAPFPPAAFAPLPLAL
mmetsp:Transcript_11256/g.33800  ORF Transcript_11256/g.33800 Transcript_11256/m.33800 type:complete len:219 (+) Transcript_11256:2348-3004(+)